MDKWINSGGETTTEIPAVNKSDILSLNINERIRVDMAEFLKSKEHQIQWAKSFFMFKGGLWLQ